jgi:PIN domain nuclease of toxin-antitoxin system
MRRLLLDTHVVLSWFAQVDEIGPVTRGLIEDTGNRVFISAASAWEISIKVASGKLKAPGNLPEMLERKGFDPLPISVFHGQKAGELPLLHKDPLDRMLVAQSQAEGLEVVTVDRRIAKYGIKTVDARE